MKNKIWDLFKLTGDIKYYIMFKEMENVEESANNKSQGNSNKGYKL